MTAELNTVQRSQWWKITSDALFPASVGAFRLLAWSHVLYECKVALVKRRFRGVSVVILAHRYGLGLDDNVQFSFAVCSLGARVARMKTNRLCFPKLPIQLLKLCQSECCSRLLSWAGQASSTPWQEC